MPDLIKDIEADIRTIQREVGSSAPAIVDALLAERFGLVDDAADDHGVRSALRDGLKRMVAKVLRRPDRGEWETFIADAPPEVREVLTLQQSAAYLVPYDDRLGGEYVSLPGLCCDWHLLLKAAQHMEQKAKEVRGEALALYAVLSVVQDFERTTVRKALDAR